MPSESERDWGGNLNRGASIVVLISIRLVLCCRSVSYLMGFGMLQSRQYHWTVPTEIRECEFCSVLQRRISDRANVTNNDELKGETCSICYTEELDTQFVPCGHTSCRRCIDRHLLNNTNCFFCNALVSHSPSCSQN